MWTTKLYEEIFGKKIENLDESLVYEVLFEKLSERRASVVISRLRDGETFTAIAEREGCSHINVEYRKAIRALGSIDVMRTFKGDSQLKLGENDCIRFALEIKTSEALRRRYCITVFGELLDLTPDSLRRTPNFGESAMADLKEAVELYVEDDLKNEILEKLF